MSYAVKEVYRSVQGEGRHAGAACVFLRFAGCNAWSGRAQDRERDAEKATCARWCDTDFAGVDGPGGGRFPDARSLALAVERAWGPTAGHRVVVATGGEPALQLDAALVGELHSLGFAVHVETNGSRALPTECDWVTVSPKPPLAVVAQRCDEVKVVFEGVGGDVERFRSLAPIGYLSPLWSSDAAELAARMRRCAEYVQAHSHWRLTAQLHKVAGVP